ncbi:MAG: hypothetical protein KUG82_18665 [Pseudomonadales bacterium]|nr:hypothetical protein [Pseudomonadales bacterium]
MRELKQSEKVLIGVLVVTLVMTGYLFFRLKPLRFEIEIAQERLGGLEKKLSQTKLPRSSPEDVERIKDKVLQSRLDLDQERNRLAEIKAQFLDAGDANAIEEMLLDIASIARRNRINTLDSNNFTGNFAKIDAYDRTKPMGTQDLSRPMRAFTLEGSFANIRAFIADLNSLKHKAIIMNFKLNLKQNDDEIVSQLFPLHAELVLSF